MIALLVGSRGPLLASQTAKGAAASLPFRFEENRGQFPSSVKFRSGFGGWDLLLSRSHAVLELRGGADRSLIHLKPVGASPASASGVDELPGKSNYFNGTQKDWHTGIRNYQRVKYTGVYPGIDLVFYGSNAVLEYDWVVQPHADPAMIRLRFEGAERVRIAPNGDLIVVTSAGEIRNGRPRAYQVINGARETVEARFGLAGRDAGFHIGAFDHSRPLVIDPTLVLSLLVGSTAIGRGDFSTDFGTPVSMTVDSAGNMIVFASDQGGGFPMTGSLGTASPPGFYVVKMNPTGDRLLFSTFVGGAIPNFAYALPGNTTAVDASGSIYITGTAGAGAAGFPIAGNAFQRTPAGSGYSAFVLKLSSDGSSLSYSTLLGGSSDNGASGVVVDASGSASVVGWTDSVDFPTTSGSFSQSCAQGTNIRPGSAFVAKLNPQGSGMIYSTCLPYAYGNSIAIDSSGSAYIAGSANSAMFAATPGAFQSAFVSCPALFEGCANGLALKLNPAGSVLAYATYLGGGTANTIVVDAAGDAYIAGTTYAGVFPLRNAF
jgi:hypothetical protein